MLRRKPICRSGCKTRGPQHDKLKEIAAFECRAHDANPLGLNAGDFVARRRCGASSAKPVAATKLPLAEVHAFSPRARGGEEDGLAAAIVAKTSLPALAVRDPSMIKPKLKGWERQTVPADKGRDGARNQTGSGRFQR